MGLLAVGLALRLALAALGWPATDSDEGTMGLMARHIAYAGAHPIFFYGQNYMGALEAYLAAGAFRVLGPSLFALRLGTILLSAGFLLCLYLLARLLYGRGLALLSLALLALGPPEVLVRQIFSGGGYAETLYFGAALMLVTSWLAITTAHAARMRGWVRRLAYAGWGMGAGLGLWSDTLIAPFVLCALVLLVRYCRRELRDGAALWLGAGLLVGAMPLVVYAVTSPAHNPVAGALAVQQSASAWQGHIAALLGGELSGTLLVAVPAITGGTALCGLSPSQLWPLAPHAGAAVLLCTAVHGAWGTGYVALLVGGWLAAMRGFAPAMLRRARASQHTTSVTSADVQTSARVRSACRLAILTAALLTLLLFAASPVAARDPQVVMRYLIGLLIALPAVLAPLWAAARHAWGWRRWRTMGARLALVLVVAAYVLGAVGVAQHVPAARAQTQQQFALAGYLAAHGLTRVYSDYWVCDRLAFLSQERVICATLTPRLTPDLDRYLPYRAEVAAAPCAAYVFARGASQLPALRARVAGTPDAYQQQAFGTYVIYVPTCAAATARGQAT